MWSRRNELISRIDPVGCLYDQRVCLYLEPQVGIARKKWPRGFALREKSGENGLLRELCCLKLLFSV